jgi:hypothetical protein
MDYMILFASASIFSCVVWGWLAGITEANSAPSDVRVRVNGSGSEQWAEVITDDTVECEIANDWSDRFRSHCIENGLDMNEYSPYTIHKDTW